MKSLLRVLIPSWRFFDRAGTRLTLRYRTSRGGHVGEWQSAIPQVHPTWNPLIFNPEGNLNLALHSLVERFVQEQTSAVTHQLITRMTLRAHHRRLQAPCTLQFQIIANKEDEVYTSDWFGDR